MGLLSEKDAKVVGERLSKLPAAGDPGACSRRSSSAASAGRPGSSLEELAGAVGGKVRSRCTTSSGTRRRRTRWGSTRSPPSPCWARAARTTGSGSSASPRDTSSPPCWNPWTWWPRGDSGLVPRDEGEAEGPRAPLDLQVFVTPTCPYCPRAVVTAFRFAMESDARARVHGGGDRVSAPVEQVPASRACRTRSSATAPSR